MGFNLLNKLLNFLYLLVLISVGLHSFVFRSLALFLEDVRSPGVSQGSRLIIYLFILIDRRGNARSKAALYNVMKSLNASSGQDVDKI